MVSSSCQHVRFAEDAVLGWIVLWWAELCCAVLCCDAMLSQTKVGACRKDASMAQRISM